LTLLYCAGLIRSGVMYLLAFPQ